MGQFDSGNVYQPTDTKNLNIDFSSLETAKLSSTSNIDLSTIKETNTVDFDRDSETISFDALNGGSSLSEIENFLKDHGVNFDESNISYDDQGRTHYLDLLSGTEYVFDDQGRILSSKKGNMTVHYDYGENTTGYDAKNVFSNYNINLDPSTEKLDLGEVGDGYAYLVGNFFLDIFGDGTVTIDEIDIRYATSVNVSQNEVRIEMPNGTWVIHDDRSAEYIRPNGIVYNFDSDKLHQLISVSDAPAIELEGITIDENGHLLYHNSYDGSDAEFDLKGNLIKFAIGDITINYDYDPSANDYEDLKEMEPSLKENASINSVATANIRGREIKFYSIGEQGDAETFAFTIAASKAYSRYNDRILSLATQHLRGFIMGPWELSRRANNHDDTAAYAISDSYIFIPYGACEHVNYYYRGSVPFHEMAHILSYAYIHYYRDPENYSGWYADDLYDLYQKYKGIMTSLPGSGYTKDSGNLESPSDEEFFADASANYFLYPESLQRYAPELYEFIERVYGEEEYYSYRE